MNLTVTPLIRIAALVGVIAIVALGGSMLMLGRSHPSTPSSSGRHGTAPAGARVVHAPAKKHVDPTFAHPKTKTAPATAHPTTKTAPVTAHPKKTAPAATHKPTTQHKTVATNATPAKHKTATKPTVATPVTHKAATATKHKAATTTKHRATTHKAAKFHGNPVYADLPASLQWELAHHKVVVVSFYNPNDDVDAISVAEAHAGAVKAGAGFMLVSVLNDKVAGILTALLPSGGLLPQPGVIVYRAPGNIATRMDGFSDRDSVAQAATNALFASAASVQSGAPAAVAAAPAATPTTTPAVTPTP